MTVAVHAAALVLLSPLAPPLFRDLEEAQVLAAVPVERADGRRVVVRLPSRDADPVVDVLLGELASEHVDQLALVNRDGGGRGKNGKGDAEPRPTHDAFVLSLRGRRWQMQGAACGRGKSFVEINFGGSTHQLVGSYSNRSPHCGT